MPSDGAVSRWAGSGGGCGARRHVGWTRGRRWHPRRSTRNTRHGRATSRCRAASDLVTRSSDLAGPDGSLRLSHLGVAATRRRLAHAIDHMRGLTCSRGSRKGQTQVTILRLHMPWAGLQAVRAPAAVAAQGGLSDTSPKDESWRSVSGGPGEPSGVTWRPRWRPPGPDDGPGALWARGRKSPVRERG